MKSSSSSSSRLRSNKGTPNIHSIAQAYTDTHDNSAAEPSSYIYVATQRIINNGKRQSECNVRNGVYAATLPHFKTFFHLLYLFTFIARARRRERENTYIYVCILNVFAEAGFCRCATIYYTVCSSCM